MRLIDADALIKMMVAENNRYPGVSWEISDIERYVTKLLPTINPDNLRPRGRWTETNWAERDGHDEVITRYEITALRCSNCCCCFKKEALWRRNYCPNCGADMRGKEDGDQ